MCNCNVPDINIFLGRLKTTFNLVGRHWVSSTVFRLLGRFLVSMAFLIIRLVLFSTLAMNLVLSNSMVKNVGLTHCASDNVGSHFLTAF